MECEFKDPALHTTSALDYIQLVGYKNRLMPTAAYFQLITYLNPKDIYTFVQVNKEFRYNYEIMIVHDLKGFVKKFNAKFAHKLEISGFVFEYSKMKLSNGFNYCFYAILVAEVKEMPRALVNVSVNYHHNLTRSYDNYVNKCVFKHFAEGGQMLTSSTNYKFLSSGNASERLTSWICVDETHAFLNLQSRYNKKSANKQNLKWVNQGDKVELCFNYFNTNMGYINFNSFSFNDSWVRPLTPEVADSAECYLEHYTLKEWYAKDQYFREIYTFEYEDLNPYMTLVSSRYGSIDNIVGKFTYLAVKEGFIKKKYKIGFNIVIRGYNEPVLNEINRENLSIDRERDLEIRVGDHLILYAIRAGNVY